MKLSLRTLLAVAFVGMTSFLFAAEKSDAKEAPSAPGSIRPKGEIKPKDLPALAKISFTAALEIALKTAPGSVIKAELEVEDGNLQYSFEIVGADKVITEVEIDAGNGKVLGTDRG
jgi:uncharacterized membrane protein YkoI